MYESPIDVIHCEMQMQLEGEIFKAVQKVGVHVDKEELIKALAYDRNQYEKGYADGYDKAEKKHRWIPCNERLPDKYTPVLVLLNNEEMCVFTLETDFEDTKTMYWEDWYGYHKKISETVAWQPLPAPYQPGE